MPLQPDATQRKLNQPERSFCRRNDVRLSYGDDNEADEPEEMTVANGKCS